MINFSKLRSVALSVCLVGSASVGVAFSLEEMGNVTSDDSLVSLSLFDARDFELATESGKFQATLIKSVGEAKGWVYLQHGFGRNKSNVNDLGKKISGAGYHVVSVSLSGRQVNDKKIGENILSTLLNQPPEELTPVKGDYVLIGHSAGGKLVAQMAAFASTSKSTLPKTVILLDGVDRGGEIAPAIETIKSTPGLRLLGLLGKPSACNASSNVTPFLESLKSTSSFVGVRLPTGSHCDAEGSSTTFLCTAACGSSKPENLEALQSLVLGWVENAFQSKSGTDFLPGGTTFENLKKTNTIKEL